MPIIRNPRITMNMGQLGLELFVRNNLKAGKVQRITYRRADGTTSDYVLCQPPLTERLALEVNAKIGNTRKASPHITAWAAGKGWRTFKRDGLHAVKCGTTAIWHGVNA